MELRPIVVLPPVDLIRNQKTATSLRVAHDTSDGESGTTAKTNVDTTRH